ncbi:DoxX family protein [Acinetobacter sp. AS23]|uniref:DoxX family protein n=1 Tax=Acinetobacter sp. AS23 TaxID=2871688 RepID=UPI00202613F5|nr:DoxX family protein [Acinetobacter sp. AS23]URM42674.1 DoxX family protein [Acinetobacter sp. AS23]
MNTSNTAPYAALLLRITLALYFFAHAGLKLFVFTPAGTAQFFQSVGVPGWMAYVTILWEILGAIFTVHGAAGFFFTNPNGGWEFPFMWIISLVALALIGDGPFSLSKSFKN